MKKVVLFVLSLVITVMVFAQKPYRLTISIYGSKPGDVIYLYKLDQKTLQGVLADSMGYGRRKSSLFYRNQ